jgi:hypothetical protein
VTSWSGALVEYIANLMSLHSKIAKSGSLDTYPLYLYGFWHFFITRLCIINDPQLISICFDFIGSSINKRYQKFAVLGSVAMFWDIYLPVNLVILYILHPFLRIYHNANSWINATKMQSQVQKSLYYRARIFFRKLEGAQGNWFRATAARVIDVTNLHEISCKIAELRSMG